MHEEETEEKLEGLGHGTLSKLLIPVGQLRPTVVQGCGQHPKASAYALQS